MCMIFYPDILTISEVDAKIQANNHTFFFFYLFPYSDTVSWMVGSSIVLYLWIFSNFEESDEIIQFSGFTHASPDNDTNLSTK